MKYVRNISLDFLKEKLRDIFCAKKIGSWIILFLLCFSMLGSSFVACGEGDEKETDKKEEVNAPSIPESEIHALSATLLDGDSGRVLYEKSGKEKRANASTTKILTCIVTLERCKEDELVEVSDYAASMPNVQLGIEEGELYYLKDLLCSLMLESHNDSAVAIAEHVAGSTEKFAKLLNDKAKEIGCENTHYITPNGLDATDDGGFHGTTAEDLAKIMKYCAWDSTMSQRFLEITETKEHDFTNQVKDKDGNIKKGQRSFQCMNRNTYLQQNGECITGKTGFTSDAGYCYVCAISSGGRKFVVSLLASGWPSNKNYKWEDCNRILKYAKKYYHLRELPQFSKGFEPVLILEGANQDYELKGKILCQPYMEEHKEQMLLADWETVEANMEYQKYLIAKKKGIQEIGTIKTMIGNREIYTEKIYVNIPVDKRNLQWYFEAVMRIWMPLGAETDLDKIVSLIPLNI